MFERFSQDARALVVQATEHARRLGHRYVGGEHILLAAVSASQPASAVMRAQGVTPELVEEEIVRRVGLGTFRLRLRPRRSSSSPSAALGLNDPQIGVEHIALALTAISNGLVPAILSVAGASAPALRAAILDRYRQAS